MHNSASNDDAPPTLLIRAIWEGDFELAKQLIKDGANVNEEDQRPVIGDGMTALHYAAFWNDTELIQTLVKYGAYVNAQTTNGQTPLYWASNNGNFDSVNTLLKLNADPNIRSAIGYSPLGRAQSSNEELVNLLKSYDAML